MKNKEWEYKENKITGEIWARNIKTGRSISKEEDSEEWSNIFKGDLNG